MPSYNITPALTRAEWAGVLANRAQLADIRERFLDTPFSGHALAALLLFEEEFGFTAEDVEDEIQVSVYCAAMADEQALAGRHDAATTFRLLGERHHRRAAKIAALLPPRTEGADTVTDLPR
jgi:hypothetical protein